MVIIGATRQAAETPAVKSEANRRPRFLVFHFLGSFRGSTTFGVRVIVFDEVSMFVFGSGPGITSPDVCGVILVALTLFAPNS